MGSRRQKEYEAQMAIDDAAEHESEDALHQAMTAPLRIVPRRPLEPGEALTGYNTSIMVGDTRIQGVTAVDIRMRPDEAAYAKVTLECYHLETLEGLTPAYFMTHPITGECVRVEAIHFEDAETFIPHGK